MVFRMAMSRALLHDEQDQRRDDVERGDHHDEADGDGDGHLLEPERREQRPGSFGPVSRNVAGPNCSLIAFATAGAAIDVVDAHSIEIRTWPDRQALGHVERRRSRSAESNSKRPIAKCADHSNVPRRGMHAHRRQRSLAASERHTDRRRRHRDSSRDRLRSRCPARSSDDGREQRSRGCPPSYARAMSVTPASSAGVDALERR